MGSTTPLEAPASADVALLNKEEVLKGVVLTSEELLQRPDLIGIDGILYDLKNFAPEHPGGTIIRAAGAYDGSALFHSMHPGKDPLKSSLLQKYRAGEHKRNADDTVYTYDSEFAKDLISSVRKIMGGRSWYAGVGFWMRTVLICALTVVFEWFWATTGLITWGVLAGIMHAQIGLAVQHDASHGALSAKPTVNALFSYGADWIGSCRWIWLQQHIHWHHPYTNVHGKDLDAQSAEPAIVFHDYSASGTKGDPPWSPVLKFQHLVTNLLSMLKYMRKVGIVATIQMARED